MARGLVLLVALAAALAFVSVVESRSGPMDVASQDDGVKKPDCVTAFDPRTFPGHGGGTTTPLPSHGGGSGTTPAHGGSGTTPSHGGGGYGTTPTAPSHGGSGTTLPAPSHGGGGYGTTPAAPSTGGGYGGSPSAPSTGGGYGGSPTTPSHGGGYGSSPSAPSHGGGYRSSPATPSHGGAYGGSTPTPSSGGHGFVPVDPTSPGTCDYWRSHPMEIWSALGRWPSSVGHFFGAAGGAAAGGTGVSIQDALSNTRADGAGALLREGAAALLNSMTRAGFPYTTEQVREAFAAAAAGGSDSAAAAQAAAFKKANEGRA